MLQTSGLLGLIARLGFYYYRVCYIGLVRTTHQLLL